jgi:hypothetical protein
VRRLCDGEASVAVAARKVEAEAIEENLPEIFKMIITLCGSARFENHFHTWNEALSLSGHCVFGLGSYPSFHAGEKNWYTQEEKTILDAVHKGKIETSHAILVLNAFAYLGESTLSEIAFAREKKKDVYFIESWGKGCGIGTYHSARVREQAASFGVKDYGSPIDTSASLRNRQPWDLLPPAGALRTSIVMNLKHRLDRD